MIVDGFEQGRGCCHVVLLRGGFPAIWGIRGGRGLGDCEVRRREGDGGSGRWLLVNGEEEVRYRESFFFVSLFILFSRRKRVFEKEFRKVQRERLFPSLFSSFPFITPLGRRAPPTME